MDATIVRNLVESYQEDGGFIVHGPAMLKAAYRSFGIDPRGNTDRRIFDLEGVTHFFQHGVAGLFKEMGIGAGYHVLSPGEGTGAPSRLLVKMTGCSVTGIDINPDQVAKARDIAPLHGVEHRVRYLVQDVEELDLDKKDFDAAYCNETTCHWQHKDIAFARMFAHLRRGAKLGINEWTRGRRGTLNDAFDTMPAFRDLYRESIWFQEDLDTYRGLLERAGFRVLSSRDCTDRVDARMRARLKEVLTPGNPYGKAAGEAAVANGVKYYETMLETHDEYVRYGVILAQKPSET